MSHEAVARRMAGLAVLQIVQVVVCVRAGWFRDARMFHEDAQLFFARAFDAQRATEDSINEEQEHAARTRF